MHDTKLSCLEIGLQKSKGAAHYVHFISHPP